MGRKGHDLKGREINGLKIIERNGSSESGDAMWDYRCHCGEIKTAAASSLKNGGTRSCGCMKNRFISKANSTHGRSLTALYSIWKTMRYRCQNPNNPKYERYGKRGIKVCDEWQDYPTFLKWSIKNGYEEGLTIDRIDNDGNYEPDNCRWVNNYIQQKNRSNNKWISFSGYNYILSDWSRMTGLNHKTISHRLNNGWSVEKALTKRTKGVKTPTSKELIRLASVYSKGQSVEEAIAIIEEGK